MNEVVFYKILDNISDLFKIKLKQIKRTEITFEASSGKIRNIIIRNTMIPDGHLKIINIIISKQK